MDDEELREVPHKLMQLLGDAVTDTIAWIFFVANVTAAVFGVVSWCVLKKFRTFRNYVLLSAIIANALVMLVIHLSERFISEEALENNPAVRIIPLAFLLYFQPVYQYWLIVLCFVFSVDFSKVFRYEVRRKYLWSNLFAWGLPLITVLIYVIVGCVLLNKPEDDAIDIFISSIAMWLVLIPVAISLLTYLAVIIAIFSGASKNNICGRLTIATLMFAVCNVILFTAITQILEVENLIVDIISDILEYVLTIILIVFVVVLKSNWKLWRDYFNTMSAPESGVMLGGQNRI